ncbi:hypothetical protein Tco_0327524 [Tanacetum coccineum]
MITPVEKRNNNKFYEFHREVGHNIDECMHLKRQIEELIKAGKLSHVIKELKQGSGKDQPKSTKKGESSRKDKAMEILMEDRAEGPMAPAISEKSNGSGNRSSHRFQRGNNMANRTNIAAGKNG